MPKKSHLLFLLALLLITFTIGGCNDLQKAEKKVLNTDYPEHPINMIVPFSAGGGTDLQARTLEKMFPKYFHQNLLVLNKPGAGGTIGWNELVKSNPDGYTLGISSIELLIQPLFEQTKYHYPTALEPIAQFSTTPFILVVNTNQPWNNLNDLLKYAKHNPKKLKFGHGGIGSITHTLGEIFANKADIDIEQVPFQGGGESISALLGNHVQLVFENPAVVREQLKSGKLKALATTGEQHFIASDLTNIPTFRESGLDLTFSIWFGVAAPKEMPPEVIEKLSSNFEKIINDPEFKSNIENLGLQVEYLNAKDSKEKWAKDAENLSKMIRDTGIGAQIQAQKK